MEGAEFYRKVAKTVLGRADADDELLFKYVLNDNILYLENAINVAAISGLFSCKSKNLFVGLQVVWRLSSEEVGRMLIDGLVNHFRGRGFKFDFSDPKCLTVRWDED